MEFLVFALVVALVAVMVVWAIQQLPLMQPFSSIVQAIVIILAAILIADRVGVF
jgi:cellulose synthase/poly-beta-1,6-N-acetylglucosamine synthase-like glycosyltransferase